MVRALRNATTYLAGPILASPAGRPPRPYITTCDSAAISSTSTRSATIPTAIRPRACSTPIAHAASLVHIATARVSDTACR